MLDAGLLIPINRYPQAFELESKYVCLAPKSADQLALPLAD